MSDLDDFFAKRLDEEASFSNRGKNWKQMSQRLDAFDSGVVQGNPRGLRLWQAAALVAVVAAGLLLWKTLATQRENKVLHQEIVSLQLEHSNLKDQLIAAEKNSIDPAMEVASKNSPPIKEKTAIQYSASLKTEENQNERKRASMEEKPGKSARFVDVIKEKTQEDELNRFSQKNASLIGFEEKIPVSEETGLTRNGAMALADSTAQAFDIAALKSTLDALISDLAKTDSILAVAQQSKDTIASVPPSTQEIKPAHTANNRFRIGAQATVGFVQPKQKGVSAIKGQGLTVEAKVFRSLWVTGSVDWLHNEVSMEEFVPKFHPHHDSLPKPPDGGGGSGGWQHPAKLVMVESALRQQHFGLGLRYELPVKFWLRPSLRVSHNWVRVSPTLITYKFEEEHPGGPGPNPHDHDAEYSVEKFGNQWLNNQWRFGLGLEKDISSWTFGLWADYSKDFSAATPS